MIGECTLSLGLSTLFWVKLSLNWTLSFLGTKKLTNWSPKDSFLLGSKNPSSSSENWSFSFSTWFTFQLVTLPKNLAFLPLASTVSTVLALL